MDRGPLSSRIDSVAKAVRLPVAPRFDEQTSVLVRGLELQADIGVNPDEIGRPQPLIVHAEVWLRDVGGDDLDSTFDYRELVRHAEALAAERIALVETFAERLACQCVTHQAVARAEIIVDKPQALASGLAGARAVISKL